MHRVRSGATAAAKSSRSNRSYWLGFLVNELPFVVVYWLLASTLLALAQGDLDSPVGWVAFGVALLTLGLALVAWRGLQAGPALDRAERGPRLRLEEGRRS